MADENERENGQMKGKWEGKGGNMLKNQERWIEQ